MLQHYPLPPKVAIAVQNMYKNSVEHQRYSEKQCNSM